MKKLGWFNTKLRRRIAAGLVVLLTVTTVVPSFSAGDEIHLINDLGGYGGGLSAEEEAERDWNEDLVSVAKSAWLDAHSGEERERTEASPSVLTFKEEIPATGSEMNRGENAPVYSNAYDVFADFDEGAVAGAVSSYLKKARKEEKAKSGDFLRSMLKEAVIPEAGVPRDNDLKKEILALQKMNDDDYEVFRMGGTYHPVSGDILFVAGHISTGEESPASASNVSKGSSEGIVHMAVPQVQDAVLAMEEAASVQIPVYGASISEATPSEMEQTIVSDTNPAESDEALLVIVDAPQEPEVPAVAETDVVLAEDMNQAEEAMSNHIENDSENHSQEVSEEQIQEIIAEEEAKALKRNAKNAVLAGIVIAGPEENGSDKITFLYSTAKGNVEIGVISANEPRIIGCADMEELHDKYCGILEELEEEAEEAEISEEETLEAPLEETEKIPNEKTEYVWKKGNLTVTATLTDPDAVPDDAELVVTPVTKSTKGYNYQAYMDALSGEIASSNENNTVLYDVAFLADEKDEHGEKTGRTIELQPEDDKVKVNFRFSSAELTDEIGAEYAEKVRVIHLPLVPEVKESADTTKDAVNIAASDISAETMDAKVSVGTKSSNIEFTAEDFSVFAIVYTVDFEYVINGKTYYFSMEGGSSMQLSDLVAKLGIAPEDEAGAFVKEQVDDVKFSNEDLVKITHTTDDWTLESLAPFTSEETLTIEMKDGEKVVVKVTDAQDYTINVEFKDAEGNETTPEFQNRVFMHIVLRHDGNSYYKSPAIAITGNQTIDIYNITNWNSKSGPQLNNYHYQQGDQIEICLFSVGNTWYSGDINQDDVQSDGTLIEKDGKKKVDSGDVLDGQYEVAISSAEHSIHVICQKPKPYTYTVKTEDDSAISFTEGPWYLLAQVTRNDGVYSYVSKLTENSSQIPGSIDSMGHWVASNPYDTSNVDNDIGKCDGTTVPLDSDSVAFAVVRAKNSNLSDNPYYFWTTDHMNVKALSGSSVDSRYTLKVVPGEQHSDIILQKAPDASISVISKDKSGQEEDAPKLKKTGKYFIVGELSFTDGTEEKRCFTVHEFSKETAIADGFKRINTETQYLTGVRSFEPYLLYDQTGQLNANAVLAQLIAGNCDLTAFHNGDAIENYRMTAINGTVDNPNATIELNTLPDLNADAQVIDGAGEPTNFDAAQGALSLLLEIERGDEKAYALQPLTFEGSSMESTPVGEFKTRTGETWYYSTDDMLGYSIIKGDVTTVTAALQSTERYAGGQNMGKYTPAFNLSEDRLTVTTTLKENDIYPIDYKVRIDMANKEQNALKPTSLNGNYYVLAYLTPKGSGSRGQVVGWTVMDVDENDIQANGSWNGTITANGFSVCNANLVATATTMGYDPDQYDLNLRLYHSASTYDNYKDIRENASDAAPEGFDFQGVFTKDTDPAQGNMKLTEDNASVIRLHEAYEKEYGIRAYIDKPGLEIPEGHYIVRVELEHESGATKTTYAYAKLKIDAASGGETPVELEFFKDANDLYWRDNNGVTKSPEEDSNFGFTGNEKAIKLTVIALSDTSGEARYGEWIKENGTGCTKINYGESINLYTVTLGSRETEENVTEEKGYIYDVLRFTKDDNGITKPELDKLLAQATDFGLYTEILSVHATDMESNIGADKLTGEIGADYGFSGNNIKVNSVTVLKQYYDGNGNPQTNKQVTLKLYPVLDYDEETGNYRLGEGITATGTTGQDDPNKGIATIKFDKLESGRYILKEVIGNQEYAPSSDNLEVTTSDNTKIRFSEQFIDIENINVNYNYFDEIADSVQKEPIIENSRHGVIVVGNEADYNRLVQANGGNAQSIKGTIVLAGSTQAYPKLDIPADMDTLRDLSVRLGNSGSSQTVRVVYTTLEEINHNNGLKLKSDGRYIVVNIDMTDASSVATANLETYIDNIRLQADFGASGSEDSSKVLYNFITKDSHGEIHPYTGTINTAKEAAGVLLAPSAIVANLGGNWGGTIICHEAKHTGSEIHSDSANKIQNKNTVLVNGKQTTGNLELQKSFSDASNDRITWFTFEMTATTQNSSALTGTYNATGLKDGEKTVTFDDHGKARVLVRAQNKVIITGLPVGATVVVEELETPSTAAYTLDHIEYSSSEANHAIIEEGKTDTVNVINKSRPEASLTVKKTWEGIDEADLPTAKEGLSITVTGHNIGGEGVNVLVLKNKDLPKTIFGLTIGETYTVTETVELSGIANKYQLITTGDNASVVTGSATVDADGETIELINRYTKVSGTELPNTGGPGTTWFHIIGLLLLASAAGLYAYKRRLKLKTIRAARKGITDTSWRGGGGLL